MEEGVDFENVEDLTGLLERLKSSQAFSASPQLYNILRYVVEEQAAGRGDKIKAYSIAVDALERADDFDPQADPAVRVAVGRLRRALDTYYENEGRFDEYRVTLPKGQYKPVLIRNPLHVPRMLPLAKRDQTDFIRKRPRWLVMLSALFALLATALLAFTVFQNDWSSGRNANHRVNAFKAVSIEVLNRQPDSSSEELMSLARYYEISIRASLTRNNIFDVKAAGDGSTQDQLPADFRVFLSLVESGQQRRLSVELLDRFSRTIHWARSFAIPEDASEEASSGLVNRLGSELYSWVFDAAKTQLAGREFLTLTASELFVLATWVPGAEQNAYLWEKRRVTLAQEAIRKNENYGPAYSVIADKLAYLANLSAEMDTDASRSLAKFSAERAMELSASDANSVFNVAQYHWHSGNIDQATALLQRVLELNPNHTMAKVLVEVYPYTCKRPSDEILETAINRDNTLTPDNPVRWVTLEWLATLHLNRGEFEEALKYASASSRIFEVPYGTMRHAAILNKFGRKSEAIQQVRAQRNKWPDLSPAHFSDVTMPRQCKENEDINFVFDMYQDLAKEFEKAEWRALRSDTHITTTNGE